MATIPKLPAALSERYDVGDVLGAGAMGVVYRARHKALDRPVALKVVRPEMLDADGRERFLQEAKLAAKILHQNVVAVFDSGELEGAPFIALEYVDGPSLRQEMDTGKMDLSVGVAYVAHVARGLHEAHGLGIIHRDVKPENILITQNGVAKVADFGISRIVQQKDEPTLTATGTILGSPLYMSPEQASNRILTPATDQYSLGVVLYELIAGKPPFTGSTAEILAHHLRDDMVLPPEARTRVGLAVIEVLEKMMAKDPADRYPDCAQVEAALQRALLRWQGRRSNTRPTPLPQPVPPELMLARGTRASGARPQAGGTSGAVSRAGSGSAARPAYASQSRAPAATQTTDGEMTDGEPLPAAIRYGLLGVAVLSAVVIAFWAGRQKPLNVRPVAGQASSAPASRDPSLDENGDYRYGTVLGNIKKRKYHIKGVTTAELPHRENTRVFESEAEAIRAGYTRVGSR